MAGFEGFDKDLFDKLLSGKIYHDDLTQFIAQMNEFTRSTGEATAAYKRLAEQGIKPTHKQLKQLGKQSVEADKIGQFATKASIARGRAGRAYNERVATHGKDDAEAKRLKEQYDRAQQVEKYASKARGGARSRHNAGLGLRENKDWILREQRREAYEQKNPKAAGEGYRHVDSKAEDVRNSIQDTFSNIKESLAPVKENISIVSHGIVEELGKSFNQGKEKIKSIATTISDFTQGIVGGFQLRKEDKMAEKAQREGSKNPTAQESSSESPLAKEAEEAQKNAESIVKSAEEAKSAEKSVSESEQPTDTPLSKEAEVDQKSAEDIAKSVEDVKKAEESVGDTKPQAEKGVIDVGNEQPTGNDVGIEQKEEQLKSLGEQAKETGKSIEDNLVKTFQIFNQETGQWEGIKMTLGNLKESKTHDKEIKDAMTSEREQKEKEYAEKPHGSGKDSNAKQASDIEKEIAEKQATLEQKQKELEEFANNAEKIGIQQFKAYNPDTKQFEDKAIPQLKPEDEKTMADKRAEIDELKKEIENLKNNLSSMSGAKDTGSSLNGVADSTKTIESQSGKTTSSLKNLDKELKQKKTDADEASNGFTRFKEVMGSVISVVGKVAKVVGSGIWHGLTAGVKGAISGIKSLASSITSLASGGFNMLKSAASTTLGNMQKLVSGGFNAVRNGASAVKKGFETVKNTMHSLVKKGTPNLLKSFSSLKSMLMRRIKRTFISSIFNQAKEGLQQLAKSSKDFNQSMSNIKNNAKQVAGNLAITLGNLIQTVEPVLTTLLGWLNKVFEAINGLFAMISGKKTMMVAKKGTDDYAKSLKGASKSAKDLNHQLYGFDEITRQEDNSGSGGEGKIGYETASIEDRLGSINDFFKNMLEAFQKGEYSRVGKLIAEQLNNAVVAIDGWIDKVAPVVGQWAENIADILNGLLDKNLFTNIGELIGDGLNLAFGAVNKFLKRFKFKTLGKRIGNLINKAFETIDWKTVGETIANAFNVVPRILAGLFEELKWSEMGKSVSKGITSFFNNIDWKARQDAISKGINGVTAFLMEIVKGVDFGKIATDLGNHIKSTIGAINWDSISTLVSTGINKLLVAFENLIDTHFFTDLMGKLGQTVGGILGNIDWGKLASDIVLGLAELRSAFWGLISNLDLPNLSIKIADAINDLLVDDKVNDAWDKSSQDATDGLGKIVDAFGKLIERIDFEGIMDTLGTKVGNLLDKVDFVSLGKAVRTGLTKAVRGFKAFVGRVNFPNIATKVGDGLREIFKADKDGNSIFTDAAELITTGTGEIVKAFGNLVTEIFKADDNGNTIGTNIGEAFKRLFEKSDSEESLFYTIGNTIGTAFSNVVTEIMKFIDTGALGSMATGLLDLLTGALNGVFYDENAVLNPQNADKVGKAISKGITDILGSVVTWLEKQDFDKIGEGIGEALLGIEWDKIGELVIKLLWQGVTAAVKVASGLMRTVITKLLGLEMVDEFNGAASDWATSASQSFETAFNQQTVNANSGILQAAAMWAGGFGEEFAARFSEEEEIAFSNFSQFIEELSKGGEANSGLLREFANQFGATLPEGIAEAIEANKGITWNTTEDLLYGLMNAQNAEQVRAFFGEFGESIPDTFINKILAQHESVIYAGKALLYSIQNANTAEEIKDTFGMYGYDISEEFAKKIRGQGVENVAAALQIMGAGIDQATLEALNISSLHENLEKYTQEAGGDVNKAIEMLLADAKKTLVETTATVGAEAGDAIGDAVPKATEEALNEGIETIEGKKDEVVDAVTVTSEDVKTAQEAATKLGGTSGDIATEMQNNKEDISNAVDETTNPITEKYEALPNEVKPYAEQLMEYITTALMDKDGTVKAAIESVAQAAVDRAKEILSGQAGIEIATTFINGIRDGINSDNGKADGVKNTISILANGALTIAETKLNFAQGFAIGKNMIVGIYKGFYSYSQALVDFIAHVCNVCADTARDILGIHSPSKVFAEIGAYTMEGMQIGLESQGENAIATVTDVANAITKAGKDASLENVMGDGLDNVASKLERIVDIFSDMADVVASMGGLQIPTLASGRTIPYSTQLGGSTYGNNMASASIDENAIENAFYSAITRAMENSDNSQNVNVYLDGRQIADSVTKYQRRQARAMGV